MTTSIFRHLLLALILGLSLVACKKEEAPPPAVVEVITAPTDPADLAGWKKYLGATVKANMEGIRQRPFVYFVPAITDEESQRQYDAQLETVQDTIARGVLPGNMLAFGSPDSTKLADLVVAAFEPAAPGSLKNVRVLAIGAAADRERMAEAVKASEAEFVFVEAK
ncbi:MAG: hypothetical protein AB7V26_13720 [Lysobacterales bacterium]